MDKKYAIYIDNHDLADLPVVQNDVGRHYQNVAGDYWTTTMAKFNAATPANGYKIYTNGSHAKYKSRYDRNPWDISYKGGGKITANFKVKILSATYDDGGWVKAQIVGTNYIIVFVHVSSWAKVGSVVNAGELICKVKYMSGSHLHIDEWTGKLIYNLIVYGDFEVVGKVKANKNYEFSNTDDLRVRKTPNGDIVAVLKGGKKCVGKAITDGETDGKYVWNLYQGDGWAGYIAENWSKETSRKVTNIYGTEVTIPDTSSLEQQITDLKKSIALCNENYKKLETNYNNINKALSEEKIAHKKTQDNFDTYVETAEKKIEELKKQIPTQQDQPADNVSDGWLKKLIEIIFSLFGSKDKDKQSGDGN